MTSAAAFSERVSPFRSLATQAFGLGAVFAAIGVTALHSLPETTPDWIAPVIETACVLLPIAVIYAVLIRPYGKVLEAVQALHQERYDTTIAAQGRKDEVGLIMRALRSLAERMDASARAASESAFQGAAFQGSSAALMLLDPNFNILHLNPALKRLMDEHLEAFRSDMPSFDPRQIVGGNMDMFHAQRPQVRRILSDRANLPYRGQIKLGDQRLTIEVSWVEDANGTHLGYVAEWQLVTEQQRTRAIIDALDGAQLRVEMRPDGCIAAANEAFEALVGQTATGLQGLNLLDRISHDGRVATEAIRKGEATTGDFTLSLPSGGDRLLEGVLAPARDHAGRLMMSVLVARDVTDERRTSEARAAREHAQRREQTHVVTTVGAALKALADGRLDYRVEEAFPEDYEALRHDLNAAANSLSEAIAAVISSAGAIRRESDQIANSADSLSRRTEKQAASLEQTAAALEELTTSVRSAAEVAGAAKTMVEDTEERSQSTARVMRDTVAAMQEIAESSEKISKINSVIDDIAFQTNLLALNAGVEAARAGESGRGFAVVASEVRALAQRSSEAAREIAELVELSSVKVKRGVELVHDAGESIGQIEGQVSDVKGQITNIARSATEQATGIAEINTATGQLDQMTQQNAALSEETNAATQNLLKLAESLTESTARFEVDQTMRVKGAEKNTSHPPRKIIEPTGGLHRVQEARAVAHGGAAKAISPSWEEF